MSIPIDKLRPKQYLRHLMKQRGLSAPMLLKHELVVLPDGETFELWTGRIGNIANANSRCYVTDQIATVLAPGLGVSKEQLLNPPADFVFEEGHSATPKMSEKDLIHARGDALCELLVKLAMDAGKLATLVATSAAEIPHLQTAIADWMRERSLMPASFAHLLADKDLIDDSSALVVEYTDDEEKEFGLGKYAKPEKKKRTPRGSAPPPPEPPKREKKKYKPRTKAAPTAAPAATPSKSKLRLDLGDNERRELFEEAGVEILRQDGKVILRQEVVLKEKDFLERYL